MIFLNTLAINYLYSVNYLIKMGLFQSNLKELVRNNIKIVKKDGRADFGYAKKTLFIMYEVFLMPPKEHFFQGADEKLAKIVQEITKETLLGFVRVIIMPLSNTKRVNYYPYAIKNGIKDFENIGVINDFLPFNNLHYFADYEYIIKKFSGRGVGGKVLDYIIDDLRKRKIRFAGTSIIHPDAVPMFNAHKFIPFGKKGDVYNFAKRIA